MTMKAHFGSVAILLGFLHISFIAHATALDDYIAQPDPSFSWSQVDSQFHLLSLSTAYTLTLTSQTWRDPSEVTPTVWTHWVTVYSPWLGPSENTALLLINGGDIGEPAPTLDPADPNNLQYRQLATATGSLPT
jgi:PhoPQ-activated pathogenicity-related protein